MSVTEIKSELAKLSPTELAEIEAAVRELKEAAEGEDQSLADSFGCAKGTITFLEGWEKPEPPEMWHAMRDDLPL